MAQMVNCADAKKPTDAMPQLFGDPRTMEITESNPNYKCSFCHRHELNPTEWGVLLRLDDIITHHFCLLFSALVEQRGRDDEGIQAFLPVDIRREIRRGKRLKCKFCKKNNATIGCGIGKCNISFHYTCGYENGCLNQFFGQYQSYCFKHKPKQEIPRKTCEECPICMVDTEKDDAIWPPCCGKQLFHRRCIMYTAKAAGYFFKCPLCNSNSPTFIQAMKANGVYIPEQDAAWELEPNAFQELMSHYSRCDAKLCLCPDGREFATKNGSRNWQIIRCNACASSATHMKCSDLKIYKWKCGDCKTVFQQSGVKDPDNMETSSSADNSDAGSTTSDSSDESSEEEEILPYLPDISHVIKLHKLSAEALSTLPPVKAQANPTCRVNLTAQNAMDESSPPVSPIKNPEIEVKFPHSSLTTRELTIPNRNVTRNPAMTPAIFLKKLEQLKVSAVRNHDRDREQSIPETEGARTTNLGLQALLHSKSLERKEDRYRVRTLRNATQGLEATQHMINGTKTEDCNFSLKSNVTQDGVTNSEAVVPLIGDSNTDQIPQNDDGNVKQIRIRTFFNCTPHHEFSGEEMTEKEKGVQGMENKKSADEVPVAPTVKRLTPLDILEHRRRVSGLQESLYKLAYGTTTAKPTMK